VAVAGAHNDFHAHPQARSREKITLREILLHLYPSFQPGAAPSALMGPVLAELAKHRR